MSKSKLAKLRESFTKQETNNREFDQSSSVYYPFWNMKTDDKLRIRFLPDQNPDNPFGFLQEVVEHNIPLNGAKRKVPCLTMYGEDCPICKVSRDYYKAEDREMGKKYYKTKYHLAQALIVEDPKEGIDGMDESQVGEVKLFKVYKQVFDTIIAAFDDDEMEEVPYAFKNGTDFQIKKGQNGDYASYNLSGFVKRETDLDDEVIETIEPLIKDLSTLIPEHPTAEKVDAMLEASLSNSQYGNSGNAGSSSAASTAQDLASKVKKSTAKVADDSDEAPVATESSARALIDKFRNREG